MSDDANREYRRTHPWITFDSAVERLSPATWVMLGEAVATCEHLAGSAMPPEFAARLHRLSLERGARSTTRIEGNDLTDQEVRDIVEGQSTVPPSRAYQQREIENIVALFNAITDECLAETVPPFGLERLTAQHARLLAGQPVKDGVVPGELRAGTVFVGTYRGAPSQDCEHLVGRLCQWLNRELAALDALHPDLRGPTVWVLAIAAHVHLAWIHPFGDGNGRLARLLEFEVLVRGGVPTPAAHLLSDHYNTTRERYYAELERTSRAVGYPLEGFVHYAVEGLVDGLRRQVAEVRQLQLGVTWQAFVRERFQGQRTAARVRMRNVVLALSPSWTPTDEIPMLSGDINQAYRGKSPRTVARDLGVLEAMGLIERRGRVVRPRVDLMSGFLPTRRAPSLE